tara:strand:+ start:293 stop:835 length:543 start_codon:yes stop_codon:yes gene_type:complete
MSTLRSNKITDIAGTAAPNIPGAIIKVDSVTKTSEQSIAPDAKDEVSGLSITVTPNSSSSKFLIMANLTYGADHDNQYASGYMVRDNTDIGVGTTATGNQLNVSFPMSLSNGAAENYKLRQASMTYLDSPSTTSSITYKVKARNDDPAGNNFYINRPNATDNNDYIHRGISTLTVMEIGG